MVIGRVGEDDGIAEQSRGVVGGVGFSGAGKGHALAGGLLCGGRSEGGPRLTELLGSGHGDILREWSWQPGLSSLFTDDSREEVDLLIQLWVRAHLAFNGLSRVSNMLPLDHTAAMGVLHQRAEAGATVGAARLAEVSSYPGTV